MSLEPPQGSRGDGLLINCVVPRAPGVFVVPAAATRAALVPAGAVSVQLLVAATNRVQEDDYAIDVTPLGGEADQTFGTLAR